ncbi:MAG: DUF4339 domain-containing protein [Verrucomicrobiota bacterium]
MQIHVAINGNRLPPQSEEQLRAKISTGEIPADALCWHEGWSDWRPVAQAYPERFAEGAIVPPAVSATSIEADVEAEAEVDTEAIRRTHLSHEASLQSIGSLYLLGSVLVTFVAIMSLAAGAAPDGEAMPVAVAVVLLVLAALQFQVGRWLRALNPKAKVPASLLAILGLLGFPIGTLINGYILYLLHSKKGGVVLSADYAAVRAATPHIRYKTPLAVWIVIGLVVALLVFGVIAATAAG